MKILVRSSAIGAVVLLAACAEQPPPAPGTSSYIPYTGPYLPPAEPQPLIPYPQLPPAAVQPSTSSFSLISPAEAAPAQAPYVPPLRPAPTPPSEPPATPADTDCGWWDPCHLWQH
jgi:hypothetical protein